MAKSKLLTTPIEQIQEIVQHSTSFSSALQQLGYCQITNKAIISKLKEICIKNGINISHLSEELCVCKSCGKEKSPDEFYWYNGRMRHVCKECARKEAKEREDKGKEYLNTIKVQSGCAKCGDKRSYVLDFHHKDPSIKDYKLSDKPFLNKETMQQELEKCIVLCSNCHREFHYLEKELGITIEDYLQ